MTISDFSDNYHTKARMIKNSCVICNIIRVPEGGGGIMQDQGTSVVSQAICFIENHLSEKLELDTVAAFLHYSKFHLHRLFTKTVGMTIHEYAQRRQLTEAAKLLVFSQKPIIGWSFRRGSP